MDDAAITSSAVVKAGMERMCCDFTERVAPLGFIRTKSRSRVWVRRGVELDACIYFHRRGSTYGSPINNSVAIRVHFSVQKPDGSPTHHDQLLSDQVRDDRGYAYHLRFNALSGSSYDRCLEGLVRITHEHGLSWFQKNGA